MTQFSRYRDRDYTFATTFTSLHTSIGLTQQSLATVLNVSSRAVENWEQGLTSPKAEHLKHFIELCVEYQTFTPSNEYEEAVQLWKLARPRVLFDEQWMRTLLEKQPGHEGLNATQPPSLTEQEWSLLLGQTEPHVTLSSSAFVAASSHAQHDPNQQRFLVRLRSRYTEVMDHSLQGAALLALGLHARPEAVTPPAHLVFRHFQQVEHALPTGTSIVEVYDRVGGELLILGEPGAGKSTLLLHLARHLLLRAQRQEQQLLPVIVNLSSWAEKRLSLAEWLVEELLVSYQVPYRIGRQWVHENQVLFLLDGLDEVAASLREPCVEAINAYRHDHLVPVVVCSRTAEYFEQQQRLELQYAVMIEPLAVEQVDRYLAAAGPALDTLHDAFRQDTLLRELATSPLMLNVLLISYRGALEGALPASTSREELQRQVFAAYTQRMLQASEPKRLLSPHRLFGYLTRLAQQIQRHHLTTFYLERLQATWLTGSRLRQIYHRFAIRVPGILIGILTFFVASRAARYSGYYSALEILPFSAFLLMGGLTGGILCGGNISQQPTESKAETQKARRSRLLTRLGIGLLIGLIVGLSVGLGWEITGITAPPLPLGLIFGLSYALGSILLQVLLQGEGASVPPLSMGSGAGNSSREGRFGMGWLSHWYSA